MAMGGPGQVPPVLLLFTGLVCMGVMINVTVVIPTASLVGSSLFDAALVISAYSLGACAGLGLFYALGRSSVRTAYLLHAVFMCIGNAGFFLAAGALGTPSFLGVLLSRAVIGLEGAVMFNASVALVEFSSEELRVRYLALYQFFVGLGLILGPGLAAVCMLAGRAIGLSAAHAFVNLVLAVWAVGLAVAILVFLPDNETLAQMSREQPAVDESSWLLAPKGTDSPVAAETAAAGATATPVDADASAAGEHTMLHVKMCAGNAVRIALRILWEAGSAVILVRQFGFSFVAAAFCLAAYGVIQTAAQILYAFSSPPSHAALAWTEVVQLLGILLMLAFGLGADQAPPGLVIAGFAVASACVYCANCVSAAPFNAVMLKSADNACADRDTMLLVAQAHILTNVLSIAPAHSTLTFQNVCQLGIFLGFLLGPLSILSAMMFHGAAVDTLAAVLLVGWVLQVLVTALATESRGASGMVALLGLLAASLLTVAVLDPSVGGTGADNLFSWHPILMALAFLLLMTWGALSYRTDTGDVVPHLAQVLGLGTDKQPRRILHGVLMASAFVFAVLGYVFIFVAHVRINESQIGLNTTWDRALHVWLGYVLLTWLCLQVAAGILKVIPAGEQPEWAVAVLKLHGTSGKYLLGLAYVNIMLGFWLKMNFAVEGWQWPLKVALTALTAGLLGYSMLPPPAQLDLAGQKNVE